MNGFLRDRLNNTCSYIHCAFYIYESKVGAHYRSTLFADLNLEITQKILDLVNPVTVRLSLDDTQRKPSEFEGNNSNNCFRYIFF